MPLVQVTPSGFAPGSNPAYCPKTANPINAETRGTENGVDAEPNALEIAGRLTSGLTRRLHPAIP